jgi:hypothetical protein
MTEHYKGARIEDLLQIIAEMEQRLKLASSDHDPFSHAQYEELAQGYTSLALAKAKLTALQGEQK